jgi:3-hydroxy acid dehydrogenase / malonic semialdehyde reductase
VLPLAFDVQNRQEVFDALSNLPEAWQSVDVLVNNAGLALGRDSFENADLNDWETMIDTNVKGLLYVTKAMLPYMTDRKKGHIINLGSTAAKEVYKEGNAYCASKHAVDAISRAMRVDLLPHKIKVTAIHPGAAETEFSMVRFKGDETKAKQVYEGFEPLRAQDIADIIYYAATLPNHVCINDLVVTCLAQANSFYFQK